MKTVLIAYATRYGSARITAGEISAYLAKKGYETEEVNLKKGKPRKGLNEYDLIVAGAGIAMFMWAPAARRFLKKCRRAGISPAVYITCGTAIGEPEKAKSQFFDKGIDRAGITPALSGIFGPAIDFTPGSGLPEGLKNRIKGTIKAMAKDDFNPRGLMDMRRREDLDAFSESLAALLA